MSDISRRLLMHASLAAPVLAAGAAAAAPRPETLLDLAGAKLEPSRLSEAALVIIDAQNEYRHGPLALSGIEPAIRRLAVLLKRARAAGTPVIHIAQIGDPGQMFDRKSERGQFVKEITPLPGETVIEKPLPNSFARTTLQAHLETLKRKQIVVAGFMTHMCVSSTVRAGFDLDYRITVAADATATRALPSATGGHAVAARDVQASALAALADFFAAIAPVSVIPA